MKKNKRNNNIQKEACPVRGRLTWATVSSNRGFIALMSTVVISAVLVILTLAVSQSGFFSRDNSVKSEYKRISKGMAESCINEALLVLAQNPNAVNTSNPIYDGNGGNVDCIYSIEKKDPVGSEYDSDNKKIVEITASAKYNGAYSKIEVYSNVYDPGATPPSRIVVNIAVNPYSSGDTVKSPSEFHPKIDSEEVEPGKVWSYSGSPKSHKIEVEPDNNYYDPVFSGDCDSSGNIDLGINDYKTCNIVITLKPQTAKLTVVMAGDGPLPSTLTFNGETISSPHRTEEKTITKSDLPISGEKDFSIKISAVDFNQYVISNWAGTDCSGSYDSGIISLAKGDNKVCVISVNKKPIPSQAAMGIITRVFNNNGGVATPSDFSINLSATNPSKQSEVITTGVRNTTYYIDPGNFNVAESNLTNYNKSYQNIDSSHLCQGVAIAGQSYLCVIDNVDIPTTFSLTSVVNITRAYEVAPTPSYSLSLSGPAGNKTMTSGTAINNLPQGNYAISLSGIPSTYSVSEWGGDCNSTGNISWSPTEIRNKTCTINVVENPPPFRDIDTVLMLDRTGSMFWDNDWIGGERVASKAFLDLFSAILPPRPQVGIGVFANDNGNSAKIAGCLTDDYNSNTLTSLCITDDEPKLPQKSGTNGWFNPGGQNQWANPDNGRNIDTTFATDSTNGHQQDYSNFNFNIPTNATITGIEVIADGKVSSNSPQNTAVLFPNGQGFYTAWTNGEAYIDETGDPSCNTNDSIYENISGDRESVNLDISSIPNGSTITSVQIFVWDIATSTTGGTYQTFVRNGTDTESGTNLVTTSTSGCTQRNQFINIPDFTKTSNTDLEIGVLKTSTNNNAVRVGAIRAIVTYIPSATISIALSSNNGSSWTTAKNVNLTTTETSYTPIGNNLTDLWGRTWVSSDFVNGNYWNGTGFAIRVQNNSSAGILTSLNYITVKVNYETINNLYTAITTELADSYGGTDLSAAISTGNGELNSSRHIADHKKYLILLSDGEPTYPGNGQDITQGAIDAALSSATTAKNSGTEIYTIHFGNVSNLPSPYTGKTSRDLTALLATNSTNDKPTIDQENNDDDHFFIVEATADPTTEMTNIFNKIGQQIINAETPPTTTTGTLNVITHVINNNSSHTKTAPDFSFTLNSTNYTGKENPGRTFTLNSGNYSVSSTNDSDYTKTMSSECFGTLSVGEEKTCIITYDDTTPENPPTPTELPPPPTVELPPTLVVITLVNNSSGTADKNASDFIFNSTNPSTTFHGTETGKLLSPIPGNYEITSEEDPKYIRSTTSCSGSISASQTKICTIIYTANPLVLPIEIEQNIDINSWHEIP